MDQPLILRPGIDLTRAGLSLEEGQLAARVDGSATVKEIAVVMGWSLDQTSRVVERLLRRGVLAADGTADVADGAPYGSFVFPPSLMQVTADLDEEERKRIIFTHEQLKTWTHYEVLQAKRRDEVEAIKRAFRERSKEWHPDRFRRPKLGPFKAMIDAIFKRVQEAKETLCNTEARKQYDAENAAFVVDDEDVAEMLARQRRRERDLKREEEAILRRRRKNPFLKNLDVAREYHQEALQQRAEGRIIDALRAAQMAQTYDPNNEAYNALVEELAEAAGDQLSDPWIRRGTNAENMTRWDVAIECFGEAVRLAPGNGKARLRLAYNLIHGGRGDEAREHANRAVTLLPDEPEAHYVLGLCYEQAGMIKAAMRAYSRALELKPNYAEAKKRLKKLRWGF